jgi:hypothetical protein
MDRPCRQPIFCSVSTIPALPNQVALPLMFRPAHAGKSGLPTAYLPAVRRARPLVDRVGIA